MEVLQVAIVWLCLISDPNVCETRFSEPFMAPYGTADQRICKGQIVDLIVKTNENIDKDWVVVSSGCNLEETRQGRFNENKT